MTLSRSKLLSAKINTMSNVTLATAVGGSSCKHNEDIICNFTTCSQAGNMYQLLSATKASNVLAIQHQLLLPPLHGGVAGKLPVSKN